MNTTTTKQKDYEQMTIRQADERYLFPHGRTHNY